MNDRYRDLEALEDALVKYRLAYWLVIIRSFLKEKFYLEVGLCSYFYETYGPNNFTYNNEDYYKPKSLIECQPILSQRWDINNVFWFRPGLLGPRIEVLKLAIKKENKKLAED